MIKKFIDTLDYPPPKEKEDNNTLVSRNACDEKKKPLPRQLLKNYFSKLN